MNTPEDDEWTDTAHSVIEELQTQERLEGTPPAGSLPASGSDVWEYSQYRASLRRNGATFALVTRDGKNALNPDEQTTLLAALNRPNDQIHP